MTTPTTKLKTFTISLTGVRSREELEAAVKAFHAYTPSFKVSKIELPVGHRCLGRFIAHTSADTTFFLDDVGDFFHIDSQTPVAWPAPLGDHLTHEATEFVYPPSPAPVVKEAAA